MIPFAIVEQDGDLLLINSPAPAMFGLTWVTKSNDVITGKAVDLMGGLFYVNAVLNISGSNVNVGAIAIVPSNGHALDVFSANTMQFQFLGGEKARLAFKKLCEEKAACLESFKNVSPNAQGMLGGFDGRD